MLSLFLFLITRQTKEKTDFILIDSGISVCGLPFSVQDLIFMVLSE